MSLPSGTRLGPYEILAPLGAGGMGEVYRARDPRLDRTVAIKILPEVLAGDQQLRDRFEREARALSALDHPHICAIYDVGELQGRAYLVMQYLEGETLADRLVRGPLPLDQALMYAMQIADALDRAHRARIVHRDLKPGNVMLTKAGAKLLDFGLAKSGQPVVGGAGLTMAPTTPAGLTMQGAILGTLQYMAPEQVEGKEADPRTDIFAFGMVLFEMLTGRKAFEGRSSAGLIGAILKDEPPAPSTIAPLTPPALDHVVRRCLIKDPDLRWQTSTDLLGELQWLASVPSSRREHPEAAARSRAPRWAFWMLAGVAVMATVVTLALALRSPDAGAAPASVRFSLSPPQALVFGIGTGQAVPSVSPDGRQVSFVTTDENGRAALWVRPLDVAEPRSLPGTQGAAFPFWSPDSQEVAFFADGQLKVVDLLGGPARTVCDAPGPRGGTWGVDGTVVFATLQGGLFRVPSSGGTPASLGDTEAPKGTPLFPTFLPDGRRFLYFDAASNAVWLGSVARDAPARLVTADSQAAYMTPDRLVYTQQGTLFMQRFDIDGRVATDVAQPLAEQVTMDSTGAAAFSVSGEVLVYRTGTFGATTELRWVDRDGRLLSTIGSSGRYRNPSLSPDDTRVAVEAITPGARTYDIWVIELGRGVASRLTFDPGDDTLPRWTADGRQILFRSNRGGVAGLYAKSADGAGVETQVTGVVPGVTPWSPTPDGTGIVVTVAKDPGPGVAVLPLAGGVPEMLDRTPLSRVLPDVSADGRWLLYNSIESGRWEVYVQSFRAGAGRWQISTDGGIRPRWGRSGREVFYMASEGRLTTVALTGTTSLTVGNPVFLFQPRTLLDESAVQGFFQQYDVARDGRILLNVPLEPVGTAINVVVNWAEGFLVDVVEQGRTSVRPCIDPVARYSVVRALRISIDMKRILLFVGAVVLVGVLVAGGLLAATFMGRRGIVDGQEVDGARVVADGIVGVSVVPVGERQVLLVDAGQDAAGRAILAELERRGLNAGAVVAILITHGHQDHTGAVKLFPSAEVMALEREVALIEGREGSHGPLTRLFPVSPTGITVSRPLHDGDTFDIGSASVQVFAVPGHTAGSAAYLVNGVLFVGDSADVGSDGSILGAPWIFSDSQGENRAALVRLGRRLQAGGRPVRALVPAHSGLVDGMTPLLAFGSPQ